MKLSVEISTYNRKNTLQLVLEKLAAQTYPSDRFEVVVADDGSTDGTVEMVRFIRNELPFDIRVVANNHVGCGANHNSGIAASRGKIVLMMADDILPEPRLLSEHMKIHEKHPEPSVLVCGKIKQSPLLPKTTFQMAWNEIANDMFLNERKDLKHGGFFVSNMSFKKDFLMENGMFPIWPSGSQEDLVLGYRLFQAGMKLIENPEALGYHFHPENCKSVSARSYMHGYNWHYIENSVPQMWVRYRSENILPSDGASLYLKIQAKKMLRKMLINRLSIRKVVKPLLEITERKKSLAFAAPFLIGKMASYYFHEGMRDSKSKAMSIRACRKKPA